MVKQKQKTSRAAKQTQELASTYLLKLVFYLIIGSLWLRFSKGTTAQIPIPVGLVIGLVFAAHEHFQIDRKIEYAVLVVAMFIGFWAPVGIYLHF